MTPLDLEKRATATLAAKVRELEEEVAALRRQQRGAADAKVANTVQVQTSLSAQEAWVVAALYAAKGQVIPRATLNDHMPSGWRNGERDPRGLSVVFHRIRHKLGLGTIETIRNTGMRLTPEGMGVVKLLLAGGVGPKLGRPGYKPRRVAA